ncbi:MAG: adenylyltransferase/cytidyltransferase family protein [Cellulomonas sp.]
MTVVGYAPGVYDLFHVGHLNILRHARQHCDHLIAGVVSDENAERVKGKAPVVPLAERLEVVSALSIVDEAVAEVWGSKRETWDHVRFDVIFKGDDWRGTAKGLALEESMAEVGVRVIYFPYTVHTSSTQLRRALELLGEGSAPEAAAV